MQFQFLILNGKYPGFFAKVNMSLFKVAPFVLTQPSCMISFLVKQVEWRTLNKKVKAAFLNAVPF